jgi:hypothetical protein
MIPYGLPLIYSTFACDAVPSMRLFLLPLSPQPWGSLQRKRHNMTTKTLSKNDLVQFTGSENWYRHGINWKVLYTDGAQHVAEHGGAYWLLDEIAIIHPYNKAVASEEFQVWKLAVRPDQTATLTCDDGNGNIVFTKEIEHTDFPPNELTLYFTNNVIHFKRVLTRAKPSLASSPARVFRPAFSPGE